MVSQASEAPLSLGSPLQGGVVRGVVVASCALCLALLASPGCHLIFPYDDPGTPRPDGDAGGPALDRGPGRDHRPPPNDHAVVPSEGQVTPACKPGTLLSDDFESEDFGKSWDVHAPKGKGTIRITTYPSGTFWPRYWSSPRYAYFDPKSGCCHPGCPGENLMKLRSKSLDPGGCTRVRIELDFVVYAMDPNQDELTLALSTGQSADSVRVSKLFPEQSSKLMSWHHYEGEATVPAGQPFRVELIHVSQCENDKAAVDRVRIKTVFGK